MSAPRLSALIVGYDSARFALTCARSLAAEWERSGRAAGELTLVYVENGGELDLEALARLRMLGARVLLPGTNLGYAGGLQHAWRATEGEPDDVVLLLNSDVAFLPGSLPPLLAALAPDQVGAAGPQASVDAGGELLLPPLEPPTPGSILRQSAAELFPARARAEARRRARAALAVWDAPEPVRRPALAGACVALTRRTVARLGGPMDTRYPLFYEDADLGRSLARLGLASVLVPASRVVHHWARSTGVGARFERVARARHDESRRRYFEKWHAGLGAFGVAQADGIVASRPATERGLPFERFEPLAGDRPPCVELAVERPWLAELAMTPTFSLAAGLVGEGRVLALSEAAWEWLFPGRYFLRALDRASGAPLGAWSLVKQGAARTEPLDAAELAPDPGPGAVARGAAA